jgi:VWFA-related protein
MKAVLAAGVLGAVTVVSAAQEQRPTFRAATDVLVVETQVVDSEGRPLLTLGPDAFEVTVGGKRRTVVSADLVRYAPGEGPASTVATPASAPRPGVPLPEAGRLFIIAVDEHSFTDKNLLPMMEQARRFLDKLQPQDHVAVFGFPTSRTFVQPTRDRAVVKAALGPALGVRTPPDSSYNLSPSEIIDLSAGDKEVHSRVIERECSEQRICPAAILMEAKFLGSYLEAQTRQSMNGLKALFGSLAPIPGRKTIVLLSGGLLSSDRIGGHPDVSTPTRDAGKYAADANASLYVIHSDSHFADMMSVSKGRGARAPNIRDTAQMAEGLDYVAGSANGHLINVSAGTAEYAFDRVLRETQAFYILGVATEPADRDGKVHFIDVKVKQSKGVKVRHRTSMVIK